MKDVYGLDTSTGYCHRVYVGGGRVWVGGR